MMNDEQGCPTTESEFRERFHSAVFGNDFVPGEFLNESFKKKTSTKSQAEIDRIIFILRHWETGVGDITSAQFRRDNLEGYKLLLKYDVETYFLNDQTNAQYRLQCKMHDGPTTEPFTQKGSLIVPAEGVFDAILHHHEALLHAKSSRIWHNVKQSYQNITQDQIKAFIALCPTCFQGKHNTSSKNVKGASKPIISESFRDRFQVDLISYHHDPAKDHNGVVMLYIITIKDHLTGFVWLRPIRQKEAFLVATELRHLFLEIGFPLIFHTDNGTEFMAEVYAPKIKQS